MATEEDLKKTEEEAADEAAEPEASEAAADEGAAKDAIRIKSEDELEAEKAGKADDAAREASASPLQLGYMRFVYAAYMAGAMLVAFLVARGGHLAWYKLGQWKPELGEPRDEAVYLVAGAVGILVSVYYWRKPEARQYATEVAEELSKVTWPSRKEVVNSTTVVLFYTLFATVFFALMDQFWKYVTDKIYSF
ncbi:MAG TPA: preprotein translocase subunit SecE [Labilithrix sp.]|jgi:preprotein translocase subunit SecE|nr:preprotein translocase subunit SecE [Labilithrix sp.]